MKKITNSLLFTVATVLLLSYSNITNAQYSISSPYSRFGVGYDNAGKSATLLSMGGVGYALAKDNEINLQNAASFSAVGQQSFVFNMGFDLIWRNLSNRIKSSDAFVASLSSIAIAFPILDRLKIGAYLSPLTDVNYLGSDTILSDINRVKTFNGNGGIDKVGLGLSYQPIKTLKHNLSIGANLSYKFGNIYRSSSLEFLTKKDSVGGLHDTIGFFDNKVEKNYNISSFGIDFGMLYFYTLNNSDKVGIGITFTPEHRLHADKKQMFYTYYTYGTIKYVQDTLSYSKKDIKIKMPMKIGLGLSYDRSNKLFAEIDFTYTQWSKFDFEMQEANLLKDSWLVNMGMEYIPNISGNMYYEKVAYRLGMHYDNGHIFLQNKRITDIGISLGIALPIKKLGTKINIGFEYGTQGTAENNLIKENYFRISLSLSAKDRWFVKRRYQ
ncbi:MAG: hypothetical protein ACTTJH_01890 [Bacteroidales bacterium]